MIPAINTALSGLSAAETQLQASATNIANSSNGTPQVNEQAVTPPAPAQKVDQVSLSDGGTQALVRSTAASSGEADQDIVNMSIAAYDFKANLKTIKAANEMQKSLLDIAS